MMQLKSTILIAILGMATMQLNAQNWNVGDRVKKKVTDRIDQGIDRTIDKTLDETERGIKEGVKEQPKEQPAAQPQQPQAAPASTGSPATPAAEEGKQASEGLKAYSKFDFIAGEKVIAIEDFSQDAIGDFPARWNTNGSGEVVTLSGQPGKWLILTDKSVIYPEFFPELPADCTIEMDVAFIGESSSWFDIDFAKDFSNFNYRDEIKVRFDPNREGGSNIYAPNGISNSKNDIPWSNDNGSVAKIYIWKQKTRLRVYVNETKIWDLPRAFDADAAYKLIFNPWMGNESSTFVTNIRMAVGAPDTRSKLITEGKFSTTGILFDVNSDKIKPESYGVLKDIANTLTENPNVSINIIGHTDSDGDAAKNLDLSKRRALSVKNALVSEFGISGSRMTTDGKGASEPVAPNTTQEGKANNRRVDFVKL
jgi:outer membrane protein OmpA-like peptidoglycan-associated protein